MFRYVASVLLLSLADAKSDYMTSFETASSIELVRTDTLKLTLRHWNEKDRDTLQWYFYGVLELDGVVKDPNLTYFVDGFTIQKESDSGTEVCDGIALSYENGDLGSRFMPQGIRTWIMDIDSMARLLKP